MATQSLGSPSVGLLIFASFWKPPDLYRTSHFPAMEIRCNLCKIGLSARRMGHKVILSLILDADMEATKMMNHSLPKKAPSMIQNISSHSDLLPFLPVKLYI